MTHDDRSTAASRMAGGALSLHRGLVLFAVLSLFGNEIGAVMRYPEIGSAVLFLPYAILTAALVVSRPRNWVWYILVGDVAHFVAHWPQFSVSWILLADAANICRALSAVLLLRWLFRGIPKLDSLDALLRFLLGAVLLAPAIGATIGAANSVLHATAASYALTWRAWYMSNALTGLTILPALMLTATNAARWREQSVDRSRLIEVVVICAALAATCTFALLLHSDGRWQLALILYAPLPALIWTALRFESVGASFALTAVAYVAIWGADRGLGPFRSSSPDNDILDLQLFVGLTSLTVLSIAAISSARNSAFRIHRALMASVHDHVAILDARGIVVEVNDAWRRFAQTLNVAPFQRVVEGDDYLAACRAGTVGYSASADGLAGIMSVFNRQQNRFEGEYDDNRTGTPHRYFFSIEALEGEDGGAIVRRRDVTARRREQLEIEEQRRELSQLARVSALGQLSGALAHELNQPLASIGSNAEAARILLKRRPLDYAEIDAILRDILSENHRAAEVIRRLRALLRRGETHLQPLKTTELINEVLELAHAELITRRVTTTSVIAPNLPPVLGDRVQLQQVLLNLILNACEAMRSMRDRRLSVIVNPLAKNQIQISIRDCGTGIAPELIDRLFEPFVTTKPEGLGLGLSISRTIVAAHGGRVWAENNADGAGATVHCVLAAALPESEVPEPSFVLRDASGDVPAAARS